MQAVPRHHRDTFQCDTFVSSIMHTTLTQWDYRDAAGELHSGVARGHREAAENAAARFGYQPREV